MIEWASRPGPREELRKFGTSTKQLMQGHRRVYWWGCLDAMVEVDYIRDGQFFCLKTVRQCAYSIMLVSVSSPTFCSESSRLQGSLLN